VREILPVSLNPTVPKPPEVHDPATVFISDSITPPIVQAFTLFITSPRRSRWWEYKKSPDSSMLYVPVFSEAEIRECREVCFPHVDEAGVSERYERWGGIPRYVLAQVKPSDQALLEEAVAGVDFEALTRAMGASLDTDTDKLSSRLLHIKVAGEMTEAYDSGPPSEGSEDFYRKTLCELGSWYISEKLVERFSKVGRKLLKNFVTNSIGDDVLGQAGGGLFERLAIQEIASGGTFLRRRLDTNVEDRVKIQPSSRVCFKQGELKQCLAKGAIHSFIEEFLCHRHVAAWEDTRECHYP
jgi:hypothetical protein